MKDVTCANMVFIKENKVLAEVRKKDRRLDPGRTVLPGGHVDEGETVEHALLREAREELEVKLTKYEFICNLPYETGNEIQDSHYYKITEWEGEFKVNEAEKVIWIDLEDPKELDLDVDKEVLRKIVSLK